MTRKWSSIETPLFPSIEGQFSSDRTTIVWGIVTSKQAFHFSKNFHQEIQALVMEISITLKFQYLRYSKFQSKKKEHVFFSQIPDLLAPKIPIRHKIQAPRLWLLIKQISGEFRKIKQKMRKLKENQISIRNITACKSKAVVKQLHNRNQIVKR